MSDSSGVEERLAKVEDKVDKLIQVLKSNWTDRVKGSFKDEPDFDDVLRYGREIRESDGSVGPGAKSP